MIRYPDHGPHKEQLVVRTAHALRNLMEASLIF